MFAQPTDWLHQQPITQFNLTGCRRVVHWPDIALEESRAFISAPRRRPRSISPDPTSVTSGSAGVSPEGAFNGSPLYGMVFGMATTKITITLENDQLAEIRALIAAGAAVSVSAFVKHAVGVALFDAAGWREMLEDALQQTGGPLTKKERTWADALLSPHGEKRVSGKRKAA